MTNPDRDTVYTNDGVNRTVYTRESNSTGWFVGIIVALALLAIAYLVFSANTQPTTTDIVNNPTITTPTDTTPMTPADPNATPMQTTPMAPAETTPAPVEITPAPAETTPAPAAPAEAAPATP